MITRRRHLQAAGALGLLLGASATVVRGEEPATPLPQAHAHNDYRHDRPLLDALDRGFCSIEADIFLVDGELLVGHDPPELRPDRTLQKLYLDPLLQLARENGGRVFPDGPTVTLLIDLKSDGRTTYEALHKILHDYREMLCSVEDGAYRQRAVQVVISGNRPTDLMAGQSTRFAGVDGRLTDLDSDASATLMPLISDRWTSHFDWQGVGPIPTDQREKLQSIVAKAHAAGRRVRFWATPETPELWRELSTAGVDHINTDQLDALRSFLLAN
ncbi:MAG: phosphatidylinositol-specific phospholipase C/glycerophosphodiester phosphodiesterase family protein [Planctomycetota bacterium]